MEVKLEELLSSIDSRFSGPESCGLYEMLIGRKKFDYEEIENYLNRIKNFGGIHSNESKDDNSKYAEEYLNRLSEYRKELKNR